MTLLVLTGMPGSGKSTVGRLLAERLGVPLIDLDARVARADPAGRSAARILADDGEPAFRAAEAVAVRALVDEALGEVAPGRRDAPDTAATMRGGWAGVVATGGGTIGDPANRAALAALGPLVCLTAAPAVLAARLRPTAGDRPLLPEPDAAALAALLTARRPAYDAVPWQVATDGQRPEAVAERVLALLAAVGAAESTGRGEGPSSTAAGAPYPTETAPGARDGLVACAAVPVATSEGPVGGLAGGYAVLVGDGLLGALGAILAARGVGGRALVVSDANVGPRYAARVVAGLERAGLAAATASVPVGEAAKSPGVVEALWAALARAEVERSDTVVALGGGVVTDVAGFAAATWLRGVRLVNAPTSLLGMVDAAVGGKTGINLPAGKNLAGAFHPPALVVADVAALATLPPAALAEGLAELVKAAVIDGEDMLAALEAWSAARGGPAFDAVARPGGAPASPVEDVAAGGTGTPGDDVAAGASAQRDAPADVAAGAPARRDAPADLAAWVARGVAVKARAVGGDLREARGGPREALNLGHTFAHGLEAASGYRLPHGQAVAIGLVAAARLAEALGEAPGGLAARLAALLARLGLPTRWRGDDVAPVLAAMARDKKRVDGALRFVLARSPGDVVVRPDVPPAAVRAVLEALRAGEDGRV